MEASVRLQNELRNFQKNRAYGCYAKPNPLNIFEWKCQFHHKGYFFTLSMVFPKNYPIDPPMILFDEKVYHPNIFTDKAVCLDITAAKWSPSMTIKDILCGLRQLLENPNPESPANQEAASLYKKDRLKYDKEVVKCYEKFHKYYKVPNFVKKSAKK